MTDLQSPGELQADTEESPQEISQWPVLEAVLFGLGRPATVRELAALLELRPREVEPVLDDLAIHLDGHGVMLQRHGDEVQLVTRPAAAPALRRALAPDSFGRLSPAAYETLAVVAYRQPVTMAQVEEVRGVNCERVLANLEVKGLVTEVGRLDSPGHPRQFGTTLRFLELLGLASLDDLPRVEGLSPGSPVVTP
ncbi:MAG: SMC-Scp complex subunit ScpB [Candidatus Dormibacteria bacterium]